MAEVNRVREDIELLKAAQVHDKEIYERRKDLFQIPIELTHLDNLFKEKQRGAADLEERLKNLRLKQREKELELKQKEDQARQLDGKLMMVKTNKEYAAMRQEITTLKADNSMLEEEIINLLDEVDLLAKQVDEAKSLLKAEEEKYLREKEEHQKRYAEDERKIEELTQKRSALIQRVDPQTAALYEKIVLKKNGLAIARVDGENCSACQMKLRPQVQNEVKLQEKIVLCENCSRILYEE